MFIKKNLKKSPLNPKSQLNSKTYLNNAKADAVHGYLTISPYLKKKKKILEVGGGIHLLTKYLHQDYDITSIEPGGFTNFTDELRNKILNQHKLKVYTTTVEKFTTKTNFDFIFSINVLEHTNDIKQHILSCINLLKDEHSLLFIQCPNYTFPFEPHFYKWFVPFLPYFTFAKLKRKTLIKELGRDSYENILNNLNFDCTYFKIKKLNFAIKFIHPLKDIFNRIDRDSVFRERLLKNLLVRICYKTIIFLRIKKIITYLFPISLTPYLIMEIKKINKNKFLIL